MRRNAHFLNPTISNFREYLVYLRLDSSFLGIFFIPVLAFIAGAGFLFFSTNTTQKQFFYE
jgi:hypothetical protein